MKAARQRGATSPAWARVWPTGCGGGRIFVLADDEFFLKSLTLFSVDSSGFWLLRFSGRARFFRRRYQTKINSGGMETAEYWTGFLIDVVPRLPTEPNLRSKVRSCSFHCQLICGTKLNKVSLDQVILLGLPRGLYVSP